MSLKVRVLEGTDPPYAVSAKKTKTAYAWLVNWGPDCTPLVSVDLYFSSVDKFKELLTTKSTETLIKIIVPEDFEDWDYIPDNY
jgi:hypothetical protein